MVREIDRFVPEQRQTNQSEVIKKLAELGYTDSSMTFPVESGMGADGKEIGAESHWLKLQFEGKIAEGRIWCPREKGNGKLLVFEPGMPGDSATWMEEKHVGGLVGAGYSVFVLRHLGTKTDQDGSDRYVHCPERIEKSVANDKPFIGDDRDYTVEQTAHEVSVAASALGGQYEQITLMGHSSGVLNTMYAFDEIDPEIQAKVHQVIGLSGFVYKDKFTQYFNQTLGGLKGYYELCKKYLRLGDAETNEVAANRMLEKFTKKGADALPEHVQLILLNAPNDEFLQLEGSRDFVDKVLGRGTVIRDDAQFTGELHGLEDMKTAQLLRMLESRHLPGIKIKERLTRTEQTRQMFKNI